MTDTTLISISLPGHKDQDELHEIITQLNRVIGDVDGARIHLAIDDVAQQVLDIFEPRQSNLVDHATRELALAGNDDDFNISIINAVRAFTSYGHSGGSASVAIPMLNDLLQFKNLTPLTNDPNEWNNVGSGMWQSSRNAEAFSEDGGVTYYLLSERKTDEDIPPPLHTSERKV